MPLPTLDPGVRAIAAGRTGSGKTTLAAYLMARRSRQHWLILNAKHTAGYKSLPDVNVLTKFNAREMEKSINKHRFTLLNFARNEMSPEFQDTVISYTHDNFENIGLCVDELYYLHDQGRPGEGLIAWLTRGRERQQTFLGLMQRPKWVSKFCFSESDIIIGMALNLRDDRKTMVEMSGDEGFAAKLSPRLWRCYTVADESADLWGAVPLIQSEE